MYFAHKECLQSTFFVWADFNLRSEEQESPVENKVLLSIDFDPRFSAREHCM